MVKNNSLFMSHEEIFQDGPKQIAIICDGCNVDETKNALNFINSLVKEGKVKKPGFRNIVPKASGISEENMKPFSIGFNLHECKLQYPIGDRSKKTEEEILEACNTVEFIRILTVDEVWYFDKGEDALPIDGRLYERLKAMEKPIRFLCRNSDNTSWNFYRSLEWVFDDEKDEIVEDWAFIGEIEPYEWAPEELENMQNNESKTLRAVSKEELTGEEYSLVLDAFRLNAKAGGAATICMIRLENEAMDAIHKLMCEISSVIFGIIAAESSSKEDLKNAKAKLDFIEADVDEIMGKLN